MSLFDRYIALKKTNPIIFILTILITLGFAIIVIGVLSLIVTLLGT